MKKELKLTSWIPEWLIDLCLALAVLQLSLTNLAYELNCLRDESLTHWAALNASPCQNGPADGLSWCILQLACTFTHQVLIACSDNLSDTHNAYGLCYLHWLKRVCYIFFFLYYTLENILFMNSGWSLAFNNGNDLHINWQGNAGASEWLHWQNA